jgi:PAS domain S-box-containing protein
MDKKSARQNEIKKITDERNLFAKLLEEANLQFEGKVKELSLLKRIGDIISDSFNIESFCQKLVLIIIEETDAENCSLLLKDHGSEKLILKVAYGIRDDSIAYFEDFKEAKVIFSVGEGIAGKVALEGKAIMITDVSRDERFDRSKTSNLSIGSILCCPLIVQNQVLGVINLSSSRTHAFNDDDSRSITIFSAFASSILNNAILYNEKSEVNNRLVKAFNELKSAQKKLQEEIDERKQTEYALLKSREFLENIFKTSADGIITADSKGFITMVNDSIEKMFGSSRDNFVGKHTSELAFTEKGFKESGEALISELLSQGTISGVNRTWLKMDGKTLEVEMNIALLKDAQGDITGSVAGIRDITGRKQAEEKLLNYQNQLKSLAAQLTLSEEKERRNFADYLHDHIGQQLFSVRLRLDSLMDGLSSHKDVKILTDILDTIKETINETRALTYEISPPILYQFGLEAALEWLAEHTDEQYNIMVTFTDDKKGKPLEDNVKIFLYQAVRELLLNVAKHARAQNVEVSIGRNDSQIQICVKDDGVGFDALKNDFPGHAITGYGLFNITERLDQLGGHITIESQPNQGTLITIMAPLGYNYRVQVS